MSPEQNHVFVICAYRQSPYLEDCILSLRRQKRSGNVCMTTSTPNDAIAFLAGKYEIPLFVRREDSSGKGDPSGKVIPSGDVDPSGNGNSSGEGNGQGSRIADDWNYALACGRSMGADYITLAHQDDIYDPAYRESVLEAAAISEKNGENPQILFTDYYELRNDVGVARCENNKNLSIKRRLLAPLKSPFLRKRAFGKRCAIRLGNAICCPAVTYVCRNIPENPFQGNMGSNIDWQLWEELSRKPGSFVYIPRMLMGHRIHEGSTTSELIEDSRREKEDLFMLRKFWPGWAAELIEHSYKKAENSNQAG